MKMKWMSFFVVFLLVLSFGCNKISKDLRIQPWTEDPWYWQYKGEPVMLLGASSDDNLFQWPNEILIPHLDSMKTVGANYVRNTMSDRQDKGFELYPFLLVEDGKYNLDRWNDEYWQRFENFLKETQKRDIVVQIEVWDRFDYSRNNWPPHPFNPKNNINYSIEQSRLDSVYPDHPGANKQPFFFTTPKQQNNKILLNYQLKVVDKMLSYALNYNHVLYCMDNETSAEEEWAVFWAEHILGKAKEIGKEICVTEMWDNWDLKSEHHKRTFDHPERYAFCDVSQNNQQKGQVHWDNFQWVKSYILSNPRPLNTVKTYGADGGRHGTTKDGLERWWRHVLGGAASVRFHRPPSGLGLSNLSMNSVKVAREIENTVKLWQLRPANNLLSERGENEAYLAAWPGKNYVLFFTNGGEVNLDLSEFEKSFSLQWYNVRKGKLLSEERIRGGNLVQLKAPGDLEWVAVISGN
ncbi:putative collagen-binding domain-containing protein [Maribellus maritimus]|uniref:putative collagen-binding domain-containing protein n=1 Tax=Maribellus maritimus TaxID=2870838 RepID=UPI001EEA8F89|nr:putative collagen-binding domain-containing protein [Maribellus maritimus]MCG6185878.1 hypothetical protein [Maribellus maritimus]